MREPNDRPDAHSLLGFAYKGLEQYPQAEEQLRIADRVEANDELTSNSLSV